LFECLLLQLKARSLRSGARTLLEVIAMRPSGLCGFELMDKTPDHTVFCKSRQKGSSRPKGIWVYGEVFVDASHLISKANPRCLWEERDKARKKKYDKLNHKTLSKVAHDSEARIGCKGGNKFWYGNKKYGLS